MQIRLTDTCLLSFTNLLSLNKEANKIKMHEPITMLIYNPFETNSLYPLFIKSIFLYNQAPDVQGSCFQLHRTSSMFLTPN